MGGTNKKQLYQSSQNRTVYYQSQLWAAQIQEDADWLTEGTGTTHSIGWSTVKLYRTLVRFQSL